MKKSRIKIFVHPVTIILFVSSALLGLFWLCVIYFASLVFHEFSHGIVANKLGYSCNKVVLYPTGAMLSGNTDEFSFKDEILVSLAGPLFNAAVCVLLVFCWWIFPDIYNYTTDLLVANLSLVMFNLLPIFRLTDAEFCLQHYPPKQIEKALQTFQK